MNTLVIFLPNGKTLYFESVSEFNSNESGIAFDYQGESTETKRSAVFLFANIAGFALNKNYE